MKKRKNNVISRQRAEQLKMQAYYKIDALRPRVCTGCGRCDKPLTHSHLIPQQRLLRLNPRFIAEPELITFHCHQCHGKFENHSPHLEDYQENLETIAKYDLEQYYFILNRNK